MFTIVFNVDGSVSVIKRGKEYKMEDEAAAKTFILACGVDNPARFLREWEVAKQVCEDMGHNRAEFGVLGCFTCSSLTDQFGKEYTPTLH